MSSHIQSLLGERYARWEEISISVSEQAKVSFERFAKICSEIKTDSGLYLFVTPESTVQMEWWLDGKQIEVEFSPDCFGYYFETTGEEREDVPFSELQDLCVKIGGHK